MFLRRREFSRARQPVRTFLRPGTAALRARNVVLVKLNNSDPFG
jgi:hypothetical protein